MANYPRIICKDPQGSPCFTAEGRAGGIYFQVGVTSNAAAAAPVRHQTIKEALLGEARRLMQEAQQAGEFNWEGHGFHLVSAPGDESGHAEFWERNYTQRDIADLI